MDSRGRAPSWLARSLRKITLASWAMHSSLPFFTAAEMEASVVNSSSLSSPMVTVALLAFGLNFGGRGMSSDFTSALTDRPSSCLTGGPGGGRGPSCPASALTLQEPPAGVYGVAAAAVLTVFAPNSCFTPPGWGGCAGGCGTSPSSSFNSALIAMRSASGANFLRNTRRRSSWPRKIRTAALASTVPDKARMNSWYCSTFPHSVKRAFTAAKKVEAETSSCCVGSPGIDSSTSSMGVGAAAARALGVGRARLAAGAAPSKTSEAWASCSLWLFILALKRSAREAGTAVGAALGVACHAPARETCFAAEPSAVGLTAAVAFLPLANKDGCEEAVGNSA
mmetsp:Transcript_21618/g.61223  ORF Transcript_21618/g.61223 Transcript_21618/m.61223 type:complete len:338 (+) Transcript_21618:914-1927(+)